MLPSSPPDNAIRLLVIEDSRNRTEKYVNSIRNAGIAVHAERADTEDQIQNTLEQQPPDMAIFDCDTAQVSMSQGLEPFRNYPEIPIVIVYHEKEGQSRAPLLDAMRNGVRDFVPRDDLTHLQLVVMRELDSLNRLRGLREVEKKLKESEDRCNALMETSRDAIAYVHEGMHVRANPAYLKMFGYIDMDEIEGMPLLDMVTSSFHRKLKRALRSVEELEGSEPVELEATCETADGKNFDAVLVFSAASIDGEPCTQVVANNQRYKKELEKKLQQLSTLDVQTGLNNRSYFMNLLSGQEPHLLPSAAGHSLLFITVDSYNRIRSETGISECDQMIKELASLLKQRMSKGDLLARFSESTFTLLTPNIGKGELSALARNICEAVETHAYKSNKKSSNLTCSIGIAIFNEAEPPLPADFVNGALRASEEAEKKGGNQFIFAGQSQATDSTGDAAPSHRLTPVISNAVAQHRFRLVYQPIVSLQGDNRENYAVMLRMLDQDNQDIRAAEFLEHAERSGLIVEIDKWMLEHAVQELFQQRESGGKNIHFFLPVSGNSIQQEGFLLEFCDLLERYNVKGSWITIQISELNVRSRIQEVKDVISGLKQVGCQLAIDHFGLLPKGDSLLKHLPVDFVKLDPSFVTGIARNTKKQGQVAVVHGTINESGAKTVATGVEDANSLAVLWNMGINYLQGYFLQEPSEVISYDFSHF